MAISLQFTDHGIEGVVPLELLPPHVRSRYEGKANDRSKRAKKEDSKVAPSQAEENQVSKPTFGFQILNSFIYTYFNKQEILRYPQLLIGDWLRFFHQLQVLSLQAKIILSL